PVPPPRPRLPPPPPPGTPRPPPPPRLGRDHRRQEGPHHEPAGPGARRLPRPPSRGCRASHDGRLGQRRRASRTFPPPPKRGLPPRAVPEPPRPGPGRALPGGDPEGRGRAFTPALQPQDGPAPPHQTPARTIGFPRAGAGRGLPRRHPGPASLLSRPQRRPRTPRAARRPRTGPLPGLLQRRPRTGSPGSSPRFIEPNRERTSGRLPRRPSRLRPRLLDLLPLARGAGGPRPPRAGLRASRDGGRAAHGDPLRRPGGRLHVLLLHD